jgi:hypothetical protein
MKRNKNQMAGDVARFPKSPAWPGVPVESDPAVRPVVPDHRPSWVRRQLIKLGVLPMSPTAKRAPTRYDNDLNWQKLAAVVAIISAILYGFWWTWQRSAEVHLEKGAQIERDRQRDERIRDLERELGIKKKLEAEQ